MKQKLTAFLAFSFVMLVAFCSCKKSDAGSPDGGQGSGQTAPNTIYGTVTDAMGAPLAGVKVRAVNPTGSNIFVEGFTNQQGKYNIQISSIGGWVIYAWKTVEYKGQNFYVRLANKDEDYNPFSTNGGSLKKDFVWKLTGIIPDRTASPANGMGYFGATMRFVNDNANASAMTVGTKVTVTLKPVAGARHLDGTNAQQIVRSFTITGNSNNYYLTDLPGSEYRVTAIAEKNGVTREVWLGPNSYSQAVQWAEFYFDSSDTPGSLEGCYLTPSEFPWYMAMK